MGSVYLAEQTEPVKRQVALKLIKTGMDSRGVLARFDAERQALAMMDHPNIARIYDGGVTPSGQPFFVMELVHGVSLTEYCDQKRLPVKDRLELFVSVCQAVQHAHQKGIIHRDLKPGNVLVTEVDGRPTPKVIDFGVAKATEQNLTDMSFADTGAIVGTPTYMSPEQADPSSMDIDTRTDVYALGVMLYELLTGSPPIDASQFKRGALLEMLRMVREVDPPRPSTRLSTADALPNIAANRSIEPARLSRLMQGELDWVVMKALEKDRDRRYDTANGFARDIQRYLADEVVEARPPSRGYRLKKFVKRNKIQVIAASLVFLTLVGGIVGTTLGLFEAKKQEGRAVAAAVAEKAAKLDAIARREEAERNLAFAKKGNEILGSVFSGLDPGRNYANLGEFSKALTDNLKKAVKELEGSAVGDPLEVAAMQRNLGVSLVGLGEYDLALQLHEKCRATRLARLGPDHPATLLSLGDVATGYDLVGKSDRSLPLYQEILVRSRAVLGPDHRNTIVAVGNLAAALQRAGKRDEAFRLRQEGLALARAKLGPHEKLTLTFMIAVAGGYLTDGKLDQALPLYEETLALMTSRFGRDDKETLICMVNLATGYALAGKLDQAQRLKEEAVALTTAKLGPDHPDTVRTMNNLATGYWELDRLDKSVPLFERLLSLLEKKFGRAHPQTIHAIANLGVNYMDSDRLKEAIPLLEEAHQAARKLPELSWIGAQLLDGYLKAGENAKLSALLNDELRRVRAALPSGNFALAGELAQIGWFLLKAEKWTEAESPLRESLVIREKAQPDLWSTFNTRSLLGGALLGQKRYTEVEPLLVTGYEGMKSREATVPARGKYYLLEALERLVQLYEATDKPEEAAKWRKELEARKAADPKVTALNERLAKVLNGEAPKDNAERLTLAQHAFNEKLYSASAQLWTEAMKADPKLARDRTTDHRYKAARSALLAAAGTGKDNPAPDEAVKAKFRKQALDWLKAELSAWKREAMIIEPGTKERVSTTLANWKQDADLASIRDTRELAKLPEGEQKEWQSLWADADALLKRTQGTKP